jgi:hypothetical protein
MLRLILGTIFVLFSTYTGWIAWEYGYSSVLEVTLREPQSTQVLIDLFIAGGLLFAIMVVDNKRSGRSIKKIIPYAILTLVFASVGPLLYFTVYPDFFKTKENRD